MEYLSKECYDSLVAELNELINVELPKVKDEIAEARDKGDLSENFEYHAAKRKQGKLLGRIRFKQRVHRQPTRGKPARGKDFHQVTHRTVAARQEKRRRCRGAGAIRSGETENRCH